MDEALNTIQDTQIDDFQHRTADVIDKEPSIAAKAELLLFSPGIRPVSAAILIAATPQLACMTAAEAAAMTGLAPTPYDSGTVRDPRSIATGRRALRHKLDQAAFVAAYLHPVLKPAA